MERVHPRGSLALLRERNREQVVDVLRRRGTVSRADIARETGLSRTTVSSIVGTMQRDGLIAEMPAPAGRERVGEGGRPPIMLTFDPSAGALVGIDFAHDRIRLAISDLSYGVLAERELRVEIDEQATAALDITARGGHPGRLGADRLLCDLLDDGHASPRSTMAWACSGLASGTKFIITGLVLLAAVTADSLARRNLASSGRA